MKLKKLVFMFGKFKSDIWDKKKQYKITENLHSEKLDYYYFLFEENPDKLNKLIKTFDINGVPMNSAYIDVENPKLHYYPISIGQFGLAVFHSYLDTNSEDKKKHFLRIAEWFYNNKTEDEKLGVYWLTDVPKPEYKVYEPWKSAFSQSRGLSILLRAWQITKESKYLEVCKKALISYTFDINEGGVSAYLNEGKPFYEEYVAKEPTMVLDGQIFSLFGLYDFVRAVPENIDNENHNLAKNLFDNGIESLVKWLPEYDLGFWLKFNLCKMPHYPKIDPCTIGYLRLIKVQLKLLHKLTNRKELIDFSNKIDKYDNLLNILRMYFMKYKALKKLNRI